ncbi:MAG: hypothetical protein QMD05_08970 [Candidatus Brocadiaceae bacterium]|nr:hypothetical protein [Candidatus Brocadiaceae bacterium]
MSELSQLLQQNKEATRNDPLRSYRPCHSNAEKFHLSGKKRRWCFGGNRSSKSTCTITDAIRVARGTHPVIRIPVPNEGRIIGPDMEHGIRNIIYPLIREWASRGSIKRLYRNPRGVPVGILWDTNSFTELMSYEQDVLSFESKALDYVCFDEPMPKPIYTANMARLVDRGGYAWGAMTLIGTGDKDSPFNTNWMWIYEDLYLSGLEDPNTEIFVFDTYDNKYLRKEDVDLFAASLSEEEKAARLHGQFIHLMGRVHPVFERRSPWVVPAVTIPFDWPIYESIDVNPGRYHAYLQATVSPKGQIIFCEELWFKGTLDDFAGKIHELRDGKTPIWTVIDHNAYIIESSSRTCMASELQRLGVVCQPAHKGAESVFAGINKVNTLLKLNPETENPNIVIMSHLTNCIYQMYNYCWGKANKPLNKNADMPDSLRYLVIMNPTHTGTSCTVINKSKLPKRYY